jgi:hypothetical protein
MTLNAPRKTTNHFLHQPSPLCQEARTLLARLHAAEGSDVVQRTAADVLADAALADFIRTRQVRRRPGSHVCVSRLLGQRCRSYGCPQIPCGDHLSEWCRGRETVAIVSQPYGLYGKQLRETMAFCEQYGLDVDIDTWPSWHFPGSVLTAVFTRQGVYLGPHGDRQR